MAGPIWEKLIKPLARTEEQSAKPAPEHCVKFRLDEGTMMMVGETGQQDLLIAPEVLVRMKDPSEDCDGFTMLTAALLTLLGVSVVIEGSAK